MIVTYRRGNWPQKGPAHLHCVVLVPAHRLSVVVLQLDVVAPQHHIRVGVPLARAGEAESVAKFSPVGRHFVPKELGGQGPVEGGPPGGGREPVEVDGTVVDLNEGFLKSLERRRSLLAWGWVGAFQGFLASALVASS